MTNYLLIIRFKFHSFVFIIVYLLLFFIDINNLFIVHSKYSVFIKMDHLFVEVLIFEEVNFHLIFISNVFNFIALKNIIIYVNFLII